MRQLVAVIVLAVFLVGCVADKELTHSDDIIIEQEEQVPSDMVVADAINSQLIAEEDFVEIGEMI